MKILVSACLIGENCKYNGQNNDSFIARQLLKGHEVFPVCPEVLGGLSCPRVPCEIRNHRVVDKDGKDRTTAFELGAFRAVDIAVRNGVELALLKKYSPSCGASIIYDGTFTHSFVLGQGIFASRLNRLQIPIIEI